MDFTKLVRQAYKIIGRGEKLRPEAINDASDALERMFNSWVNRGVTTWRLATQEFTLAEDASSVALTGANIFGLASAQIVDGSDVYDLRFISRKRFDGLISEDTGRPTRAMYQAAYRGEDPVIQLYPTTDKDSYVLKARVILYLPDPSADLSYPMEWDNAILFGLAVELGYLSSVPMDVLTGIVEKFKFEFSKAKGADREVESSCFVDSVY